MYNKYYAATTDITSHYIQIHPGARQCSMEKSRLTQYKLQTTKLTIRNCLLCKRVARCL